MKLSLSSISNPWFAAATVSLTGHVAAVAVIAGLESTTPADGQAPITVDIVILDDTVAQPAAPIGTAAPDETEMDATLLAVSRPAAPPESSSAPLPNTEQGVEDELDIEPIKRNPATSFTVAKATIVRSFSPDFLNRPKDTKPELPQENPATPLDASSLEFLAAPPSPKSEPAVHLPRSKPPLALTGTQDPVADHSEITFLEPSTPIAADEAEQEADPAAKSLTLDEVPLPRRPQSAAVPDPPATNGTELPASGAVQVASAIHPMPEPVGVTRGVQVVGGNRPPRYPMAARRQGLEGHVLLRIEVDGTGVATRVTVSKSSGHRVLDDSALRAAKDWRFLPALVDGRAASGAVDVPITFRLD